MDYEAIKAIVAKSQVNVALPKATVLKMIKELEDQRHDAEASGTLYREEKERADGLQAENERLREFARHVIKTECWAVDGADIQGIAIKLGLIEPHTATQDDVDEFCDYEVGDTIYKFSKTLKG